MNRKILGELLELKSLRTANTVELVEFLTNTCIMLSFKYSFILNVQAEHDRVMEKWTEKMSREGKMAGILAAQARVADLKEY